MGITPIDLQTIFSQVDKVGKYQTVHKEGQLIQQAIQGAQIQRKMEEHIQEVNEAQNTGEGAEKINDNAHRDQSGGKKKEKGKSGNAEENREIPSVLSDPSLGKKIDISL
ncbi:MAG: hypothetical protein LBH44_13750 [Treponema sp.]|jgi:hypothetical protein|nr:hypothetical protein [Treponema sp.]